MPLITVSSCNDLNLYYLISAVNLESLTQKAEIKFNNKIKNFKNYLDNCVIDDLIEVDKDHLHLIAYFEPNNNDLSEIKKVNFKIQNSLSIEEKEDEINNNNNYNIKQVKKLEITKTIIEENTYGATCLIRLNDQLIATGCWDPWETIKILNTRTGHIINKLKGHTNHVNCLALLLTNQGEDETILASGSSDDTIKLWNIKTGQLIDTLIDTNTNWEKSPIVKCLLLINSETLASGCGDNLIKLWNLKNGQLFQTLKGHTDDINCLIKLTNNDDDDDDEQRIASGSNDKTIKIWNLLTGQIIKTLYGHDDNINCLQLLNDNETLASGSSDTKIKLWHISSGQLIKTLNGHKYSITSIVSLNDNETIVSSSWDRTIKLWNINTGELVQTLFDDNENDDDHIVNCLLLLNDKTLVCSSGEVTHKIILFNITNEANYLSNKHQHAFIKEQSKVIWKCDLCSNESNADYNNNRYKCKVCHDFNLCQECLNKD
jgi:WD40 repeat protein